jgi:hypothetical protein
VFSASYDLNLLGFDLISFSNFVYIDTFIFFPWPYSSPFFSPPHPSPVYCPKERIFCFYLDRNDSFAVSRTDLIHPYNGQRTES